MNLIAEAEHNEHNWPSNSFPKGAKLVFIFGHDDFTNSGFLVVGSDGSTPLLPVDDLIKVTIFDEDMVDAGKTNVATGAQT